MTVTVSWLRLIQADSRWRFRHVAFLGNCTMGTPLQPDTDLPVFCAEGVDSPARTVL